MLQNEFETGIVYTRLIRLRSEIFNQAFISIIIYYYYFNAKLFWQLPCTGINLISSYRVLIL